MCGNHVSMERPFNMVDSSSRDVSYVHSRTSILLTQTTVDGQHSVGGMQTSPYTSVQRVKNRTVRGL